MLLSDLIESLFPVYLVLCSRLIGTKLRVSSMLTDFFLLDLPFDLFPMDFSSCCYYLI